ncbi:hypothetical protein SAMN05444161_3567 [Rhizobiales bacterium GAS191]|nr:hypothetical protein SAMN05444161_3567 [Rhizobiales bacterium GAS191]
MKKTITYCTWESDPAILVEFEDGRVHGYYYTRHDKAWHNGARGADVATKGRVISKAQYDELYPDIGLPPVDLDADPVSGSAKDDPRAGALLAGMRAIYTDVSAKLGPEWDEVKKTLTSKE